MKDIIESPATGADRAIGPLTPSPWTHDPQECDGQREHDDQPDGAVATTCRGHRETDPQDLPAPATEHSGHLRFDAHSFAAAVTSSGDQCPNDALSHDVSAPPCDGHCRADNHSAPAVATTCPDGQQIGGQINSDDQSAAAPDLRFSDPLVQDIVEVWRLRNQMVKSNTKLALQAQAMCRRYVGGDKEQATKLYAKIKAGKTPDGMEMLESAILPFIAAMQPVERQRKAFEKQATKWAERLPIAAHAKAIKGFGYSGLARVVGECGDLSAYRTVSGVWKRAGLAVINGKRQRRVAGEEAIEHGYSPARRASFWNCMDALFRHQGKDDDATDWRRMYDVAKEKAMESETITMKGDGTPNGKHADARARRYVMKAILKHLTIAWRAANRSKEHPNA